MAYEQVKKPSSSVVPVQKKVSGFAPPASRVQAKQVTAGEQEQMPLGSTPATDANWLMKHPLFKGNQFLQRVVAPASESESLESEESLAQRETVQRQEEGKEFGTPYSLPVQAKLTIGEPGDKYEQEADRVASQVVKQINSPEAAQPKQGQSVQRQEEPVEELQRQPSISDQKRSPLPLEVQREAMPAEEELQAKSILQRREAIAGGEASTDLDSAINRARGGGQPLDAGLQRSMGQAMGADFSGVKVHTDAQSDQLNQSIQAKAFTTGQDVFFRQGAYDPGSRGGQELIAHELTHVVQQSGGAGKASIQRWFYVESQDQEGYRRVDDKEWDATKYEVSPKSKLRNGWVFHNLYRRKEVGSETRQETEQEEHPSQRATTSSKTAKKKKKNNKRKGKSEKDPQKTLDAAETISQQEVTNAYDEPHEPEEVEEDVEDGGGWETVSKSEEQKAKKAAKKQAKDEKIQRINEELDYEVKKWRDSGTTPGTINNNGSGSQHAHDCEDSAKKALKDGNLLVAIDKLDDAISWRQKTLSTDKSDAGYAGHLAWINKLNKIRNQLQKIQDV
jgi:hypothetical protein